MRQVILALLAFVSSVAAAETRPATGKGQATLAREKAGWRVSDEVIGGAGE